MIRTRERMEMQETYVTATGEPRIVQTLKTLVPLEGRTPLIIGISWDITNNTEYRAGIDIRPYQSRTVRQVENRFPCQYEP